MGVNALALQAQAILDAAEAALVPATTGVAAPATTFRSHGLPNLELCCGAGELAVWLERVEHRQTDPPGCDAENIVHWVVGLYRCWPSQADAEKYDDAAEGLLIDAWALLTEFYDQAASGNLLGGCACESITLGDLTPSELEPSGGCGGWEFRLSVSGACLTSPAGS